jgi:D-alanyl-D-alanine carboxypeptidase
VDGFVFLMNQKARENGMLNTHFANPNGLDDHKDHYSTAYDMALLTRYAMKYKQYRKIVGTKVYRAPNPTEDWDRIWKNKNRLLTKYRYCTGGKTGYTKLAKRTLVTTATKGDMDLIAVTINDSNDWNDHISMYESGFKGFDMAEILSKGSIDVGKNKYYKGNLFLKNTFVYPATSEEMNQFRVKYKLRKPKENELQNDKSEWVAGKAVVYLDGKVIKEVPIYFQYKTEKKTGFFSLLKQFFLSIIGVKTNG